MYSWRVPLKTKGELTVFASYDIGKLGPKEGAPARYTWSYSKTLEYMVGYMVVRLVPVAFVLIVFVFIYKARAKNSAAP